MACVCCTRSCQSSESVRDAPGLFCQGCSRSVPASVPLPSRLFGGRSFSSDISLCCAFSRLYSKRTTKRKRPHRCDGASPTNRTYLLAEAVDQAALEAQVILLCAVKVRVQILELDRTKRHVAGQLEIGAAAERHRKRVHGRRREAGQAGRRSCAAEQHLGIRREAAGIVIRQARSKQVVDFMGRAARRQAGDFAETEVADDPDPRIHVGCERATCTLAAGARSTLARIDSDILILYGN